jgi:hypothetical protein
MESICEQQFSVLSTDSRLDSGLDFDLAILTKGCKVQGGRILSQGTVFFQYTWNQKGVCLEPKRVLLGTKRVLLGTKRALLWRQPKNPVGTLFSKSIQLEPCWSLLCNPARWLSWLERGVSTPRLWVQFQPDPNVLTVTVESICYTQYHVLSFKFTQTGV